MPYKVIEKNGKWLTINSDTGHVKGSHESKEKAMKQLRLLYMIEKGWKENR